MRKIITIPMLVLILALLFIGCNNNDKFNPVSDIDDNTEIKTQQKSVYILHMSDLEIIKRSADYLKSSGINLAFEETKILYENNPTLSPICKDKDNQDVYYSGDYLKVYFYPHPEIQDQGKILLVFIGEDGKVLGYAEEDSQG